MHKQSFYIINGITVYRIIASVVLLALIFLRQHQLFAWLLPVSFFTDLIDGFLARKYQVTSVLGSQLDSIGDDLTILVALIGAAMLKRAFVSENMYPIIIMFVLWFIQTVAAFFRYGRITSFHTYLAKIAALLQGSFLILLFLLLHPPLPLFYLASFVTILDLIEEIILVFLLPRWEANVKGIYWWLKK